MLKSGGPFASESSADFGACWGFCVHGVSPRRPTAAADRVPVRSWLGVPAPPPRPAGQRPGGGQKGLCNGMDGKPFWEKGKKKRTASRKRNIRETTFHPKTNVIFWSALKNISISCWIKLGLIHITPSNLRGNGRPVGGRARGEL